MKTEAMTPFDAALPRVRRRYRRAGMHAWCYASIKVATDPCYRAAVEHIPEDSLTLDLGCGMGLLGAVLGELGGGRRVHGVEYDPWKVKAGRIALEGLEGIQLHLGDLREAEFPPCHTAIFLDVLHYFEPGTQRDLIQRAASALHPGGKLLVRETPREAARAQRWERMALALGWNRGTKAWFRSREAWAAEMAEAGLAVEIHAADNRMNRGNMLLVGTKDPA